MSKTNVDQAKALLVKFLYVFFDRILYAFRNLLFCRSKLHGSPDRILIYRIGQVGDIVCAIPAMIAVRERFPGAHITLLTSPVYRNMPGAKELLRGADFLDEMIVYYHDEIESAQGVVALAKRLRRRGHDLFVELPSSLGKFTRFLRDMVFAKALGCKYALGFRMATLRIFVKAQARCIGFKSEAERLLGILADEGIPHDKVVFRLPIKERDARFVDELFEEYGVGEKELCVAINPGAKRHTNRWPKELFAVVSEGLRERYDAKLWITGGQNDKEVADWIAHDAAGGAMSVAGKTSLLQLAELLRRCKLLVTNDTGTMHLAEAVDTPVVAVFSARDFPNKWYPYGERHMVIRKAVNCEVCFQNDCRHLTCLRSVSAEEVLEAVERVIGVGGVPKGSIP